MSLDFTLQVPGMVQVARHNCTHNLAGMARAAGLYEVLWHPEKNPAYRTAGDVIPVLLAGLQRLAAEPDTFRQYEAPNGWGTYAGFVAFVAEVLSACQQYPEAQIEVSR